MQRPAAPDAGTSPVVSLREITKRFPGVVANDRVSLDVRPGEIHAIVGENGAGKSTLMKILYGLYQPDSGDIALRGRPVRIDGPARAVSLGIGMVHQHFMLIPRFTVAENIVLGHEVARFGLLDQKRAAREITGLAQRFGFAIDPASPVSSLSVGQQQRVEILKVLFRGADILILDEPTAVLVPQEVTELFANLRHLAAQGKTIIFIGHKLDEVLGIADRITVLRRGRTIGTVDAGATTRAQLAEMMVGRPVLFRVDKEPRTPGAALLTLENMTVPAARGRTAVKGLSLKVRAGEIYGVAGVEGNGQTEMVEGIFGLSPVTAGRVLVRGREITNASTARVRGLGLAYIPEDRHRRGLVLPMSIWENLILGAQRRREFLSRSMLDRDRILAWARAAADRYDIRLADLDAPVLALSGGNQQKTILARELTRDPEIIVASQPTRGLDVGAAEFIRRELVRARDDGRAVLLISADLEEVLSLSDRIGVLFKGRIVAEFDGGKVSPLELGAHMVGGEASA